jgi:oxygen-dependent protoporphyrinogen oxidase
MENKQVDVLIVGAGLSGLSAANFLKTGRPDRSLLVLEKGERPGGAILSHSEEGYLAEWGAHGFLDNCEESRALIGIAGLEKEVEKAPLGKFVRYVCLQGELNLIPQSPMKIIRAPLMPFAAKLRVLGDIWKKPLPGEPSVAEWVEHRFGSSMLPFADAVFTGTYAGDIQRLKIDAVMPGVRKLEKENGSVIRGVMKKMMAARKKRGGTQGRKEKKGPALPAMTSFAGGMGRLPQGLAGQLRPDEELRYRTEVIRIRPAENGWEAETAEYRVRCRHLVLAVPINRAISLLNEVEGMEQPPALSVPEARIVTIALGFTEKVRVPFGFGYLAPEKEQRFALGALFSSHMFPGRAPDGKVLLEVLVGGRRHPERLDLDDEELVERAYRDLAGLIDMPERPVYSRVLRSGGGIPQLEEGYTALLEWKNRVEDAHRGLHVCGFGWHGIGINDMTKEAKKAADSVLRDAAGEREEAEVKGVYF